jgi:hypothetical protein
VGRNVAAKFPKFPANEQRRVLPHNVQEHVTRINRVTSKLGKPTLRSLSNDAMHRWNLGLLRPAALARPVSSFAGHVRAV